MFVEDKYFCRRLVAYGLLLSLLGMPGLITAEEVQLPVDEVEVSQEKRVPMTYVSLRGGAGTSNGASRPAICLELSPVEFLSVEGCGSGRGFLHNQPGRELTHFRTNWKFAHFQWDEFWLTPAIGAGFAELEVGVDQPGFRFDEPDEAEPNAVAGPEVALSLHAAKELGEGVELLVVSSVGYGYFSGAPQLSDPQSRNQPFADLSIGFGW